MAVIMLSRCQSRHFYGGKLGIDFFFSFQILILEKEGKWWFNQPFHCFDCLGSSFVRPKLGKLHEASCIVSIHFTLTVPSKGEERENDDVWVGQEKKYGKLLLIRLLIAWHIVDMAGPNHPLPTSLLRYHPLDWISTYLTSTHCFHPAFRRLCVCVLLATVVTESGPGRSLALASAPALKPKELSISFSFNVGLLEVDVF